MIGGLTKGERKVLTDFFQAVLSYNEAAIALRRGATPRGPDRIVAEMESEMVRVIRAALDVFGAEK